MKFARSKSPARAGKGFTLIEVLATLMLMAIVLPAVMRGATLATAAASTARRRTEAAGLAEAKLGELVAAQQFQGNSLSGDFGADWPDYKWEASVQSWSRNASVTGLQQVDVRVLWTARGRPESIVLSTLAYTGSTQTTQTTQSTPSTP